MKATHDLNHRLDTPCRGYDQAKNHFVIVALILAMIAVLPATAERPGESDPSSIRLRLHGAQTTLYADNVPLSAILQQFRQWDVAVDFMPVPDPRLSVRMESVDTETALANLLEPYDYLLRWQMVSGPVGRLPKLKAIRLVGPAGRQAAESQPYHGSGVDSRITVMPHPEFPNALMIRDELLLRVKPGVQIDEFKRLLDQIDGGVIDGCPLVGVYRVRLRPHTNIPEMVARLRQHAQVDRVEPHWAWRLPTRPAADRPAAHTAAAAATATRHDSPGSRESTGNIATTGRLAILDTGIREDVPWRDALHAVLDFVVNDGPGDDSEGHGTRMAGLAGGFLQPLGIDHGTTWDNTPPDIFSMKIFDANGVAPLFSILQGVEQAIASEASVISLSWGGPQNSRFLEEALIRARQQGVLTLAAAGNEPTAETMYPAASPAVVAVGALQPDGQPWEQSGYGPSILLAAPGFAVGQADPSQDEWFAGTSVATAYAAGIFARFNALHGERSVEENLRRFLDAMTPPSGDKNDDQRFPNAGRLDDAALQRLFAP